MKPDWILVANASEARLLQREPGAPMVVVNAFHHPASRQRTSELGDDKAGREKSGHGFGGAAFEPRTDAHRKELRHFAHEIATYIEHAAQQGQFHKLVVFASNPFMGELKHGLGDATQRVLTGTHEHDLTGLGLSELETRVDAELSHTH